MKLVMVVAISAACGLAGCAQSYKGDTYAASAVQQANKVDRAAIVGFRQVRISANGTVGAVTGGAVGGILGSQSERVGINSALGTIGGTALGGIIGTTIEHVTGDATGWEYIIQKKNGDLLSVTQQDDVPIAIGQKVLLIAGSQARIVADYSVEPPPAPPPAPAPAPAPTSATTDSPPPETAPAAPAAAKPSVTEQPAPADATAGPQATP